MKTLSTLIIALFTTASVFSQAPHAFNYQGVARDLSGTPLSNQSIGLQIAILQGSVSGTEVYKETHSITTNNLGLFNIQIGNGNLVNGNIGNIDWGNHSHFIQVEMDETGGNNYQLIGTSQLLSVPYALYAENGSKWNNSQFNDGLQYGNSVVIGEDTDNNLPLLINSTNPIISATANTNLASFKRSYSGSEALFNIYGYPDTDLVFEHLRNSVMLYATADSKDLVLCAAPANGAVRFITDDWSNPLAERARITSIGLGIGTTNPKEKLHIANGDIFIEDINKGVIMTSPNGQCWRYTPDNTGQLVPTAISCPN